MTGHVSEHFNILLLGDVDTASAVFGASHRTMKHAGKECHLEFVKGPKGNIDNMADECKNIDEIMICVDLSRRDLRSHFFQAIKKAQADSYCRVVVVGVIPEGQKRQIDKKEIKDLMLINGINKGSYCEVDKDKEEAILKLNAEILYTRKQEIQGKKFMKVISDYKTNKREERDALRALYKYMTLTVINRKSPSEKQYEDILMYHMHILNKGELGKRFKKFIDSFSLIAADDYQYAQRNSVLISNYFIYQLAQYKQHVKRKDKQVAATALMRVFLNPTEHSFLVLSKHMLALSDGRLGEMYEDVLFKRANFFKPIPGGQLHSMQEHLQKQYAIHQLNEYIKKRSGEWPWSGLFKSGIKQDKIAAANDLIKAINNNIPISQVMKAWNDKNKKVFRSSDRLGKLLHKFNKPNYSVFEREVELGRGHSYTRRH
jgi:hypothetical protein